MNESLPSAAPISPAPSAPDTPAPAPAAPSAPSALNASEAETMAQWVKADLASGKITPEQADKAFADLNTPMDQRAPDQRTEEQKAFDQHFPPAKENEFLIRYGLGDHEPMSAELKQFDTATRGWLAEAGFTRELGTSLGRQIEAVTRATHGKTEAELELYGYTEYAKLERFYGDALASKLQQAGEMVEALETKRPGLKALLKTHGIGDNAVVASLLIQQAERAHWRKR